MAADGAPKTEAREETLATQVSYVVPSGTPTTEQFDQIRERFIDSRKADAKPEDLFAFELIACSDGLDSYFTRHDLETGLKRFVDDLKVGQSVLGNHDYRTFSYGSSYDAVLEAADPKSPMYEPVAYREWDKPELRTANWVRGSYFVVRGVDLNGQPSDSLIRAMEFGGVRKTSITFSASEFECSVCGQELLAGLWDWDDDDACTHFPGVVYERDGEKRLCWALMKQEELYETSMVYKNASPSSMYVRKAEALASAGLLAGKEVQRLEQRLHMRLPRHDGGPIMVPAWSRQKEETVAGRRHPEDDPAATQDEEEPAAAATGEEEEETSVETPDGGEPAAEETEPTAEDEAVEAVSESVERAFRVRGALTTEQLESIGTSQRQLEKLLTDAGFERSVGAMTARQYETRDAGIQEALGGDAPTVERIRSLADDAQIGQTLYGELVRDAVAAKVRASGETLTQDSKERYERQLMSARDPEFVRDELRTWGDVAKGKFASGRQTAAPDPDKADSTRKPSAPAQASSDGQESVLSARSRK